MKLNILDTILEYCERIKNGRTLDIIHDALLEEVEELEYEIDTDNHLTLTSVKIDGIVGESVDVALCAIDMAYKKLELEGKKPSEIKSIIDAKFLQKLDKWERVYG